MSEPNLPDNPITSELLRHYSPEQVADFFRQVAVAALPAQIRPRLNVPVGPEDGTGAQILAALAQALYDRPRIAVLPITIDVRNRDVTDHNKWELTVTRQSSIIDDSLSVGLVGSTLCTYLGSFDLSSPEVPDVLGVLEAYILLYWFGEK